MWNVRESEELKIILSFGLNNLVNGVVIYNRGEILGRNSLGRKTGIKSVVLDM